MSVITTLVEKFDNMLTPANTIEEFKINVKYMLDTIKILEKIYKLKLSSRWKYIDDLYYYVMINKHYITNSIIEKTICNTLHNTVYDARIDISIRRKCAMYLVNFCDNTIIDYLVTKFYDEYHYYQVKIL